jgi:hypothetical protein
MKANVSRVGLIAILCAWSASAVAQAQTANWLLDGTNAYYTAGNVGIGTATPANKLQVTDQTDYQLFFTGNGDGAGQAHLTIQSAGSVFFGSPVLVGKRSRGTIASPTALLAADEIFRMGVIGNYNGAYDQNRKFFLVQAGENWTASQMGFDIALLTRTNGTTGSPTERVRILNNGNVGIGTATPTAKLHVVGDATFTGSVTGGNIQATYQDIAEWVPSSRAIAAGTVVSLDPERPNNVLPSSVAYDTRVAGVVSDKPGLLLGVGGEGKLRIATMGRVKVRVRSELPVKVGDLLVTSGEEGLAMVSEPIEVGGIKIHRPGTLIGKALEPMKPGTGEILVLLSLQ